MNTLIITAVVVGYIVQWGAALIVVLRHAQEKTQSRPERLMR